MKIGFVRRGHSRTGGAEAYMLRLARSLHELGHQATLITSEEWPADRWPFGKILRLPATSPDSFARAFRSNATGCDIHFSLERVPGCEVFRAGDGVHAAWLDRRKAFEPLWKRLARALNRKHARIVALERQVFNPANTQVVIANSHMVRDEILSRYSYPADRIAVVYNGITPAPPGIDRTAARQRFGIDTTAFCPLFLGTGWDRKGLSTALRAVEMMDGTQLLVAGRGPADIYRARNAVFAGPVLEVSDLFAAADLLVLPTWYDPFSNACLEALAAGLPVITTTANGFSEIIQPGIHGEVVAPGDALACAEAMEAWRVETRCANAREACQALASEYSMRRNASETLAVLERAAALNSPVATAEERL
jgi:UDP-glucose:(heptosyl)LPS alpha-1,3-glucosyltransferase